MPATFYTPGTIHIILQYGNLPTYLPSSKRFGYPRIRACLSLHTPPIDRRNHLWSRRAGRNLTARFPRPELPPADLFLHRAANSATMWRTNSDRLCGGWFHLMLTLWTLCTSPLTLRGNVGAGLPSNLMRWRMGGPRWFWGCDGVTCDAVRILGPS